MTHSAQTGMLSPSALLQPAFGNPVAAIQQSFRAALKALSEPGIICTPGPAPSLETMHPATYALCLGLLDADTPLWLCPGFDTPAIRANLAFHCGCPLTAKRDEALFALLDGDALSDLSDFNTGSERYPDQSCTLLIQLGSLEDGTPLNWFGPGIDGKRVMALPVSGEFWGQRTSRKAFPRGLDVFFSAGNRIAGLPRSTRVENPLREAA